MAITPFRLAYLLSDFFFILLYYVISYRKNVVKDNLNRAFPEKSEQELRAIRTRFYKHLSDLLIEGLKGLSMSGKQIIKRHHMVNPEVLEPYFKRGKSVIGVTGHYGNWEWGALSGGLQMSHLLIAFYKPIGNPYIDRFMRKRRAKFNCRLASIKETYSTFEETRGQNVAYMMVADQSPTNLQDCYWIPFLGQDTACLHGPEKYARLHRLPVFYVDIQKKKRGYYEMTLSLLAEDTIAMEPGKLTAMFMNRLEEAIRQQPGYWLWSHKRWKHKKGIVKKDISTGQVR